MKKTALILAAVLLAAPAVAQERVTDMVDEGQPVDSLLLRYRFEGLWALDKQNVLLRDSYREHYQITFEETCNWVDLPRSVNFVPPLSGRVRASLPYEARDKNGQICMIARIAKVPKAEAMAKIATVNDRG